MLYPKKKEQLQKKGDRQNVFEKKMTEKKSHIFFRENQNLITSDFDFPEKKSDFFRSFFFKNILPVPKKIFFFGADFFSDTASM